MTNQSGATMLEDGYRFSNFLFKTPCEGYLPLCRDSLPSITLQRFRNMVSGLVVIPALGLTKFDFIEMLGRRVKFMQEVFAPAGSRKTFKINLTFSNAICDYQHRVAQCILKFEDRNNAETRKLYCESLLVRLICHNFSEVLKNCTLPTATYVFHALQVSSEAKLFGHEIAR